MFALESKVRHICELKKLTIADLVKKIDMSYGNLFRCFKKNDIMTKDLLQIAKALDVHPKVFFEEEDPDVVNETFPGYGSDDYLNCLEEIREINKENRELNKRIRELEEELRGKKTGCPENKQKTTCG